MKKLLSILLLILPVFLFGQTVIHGFTFYAVNSNIMVGLKFPSDTSGSKKFATLVASGGNGECGTDGHVMFNVGVGRQFLLYPSLMPDSIIYALVMPINTGFQAAMQQPNNMFAVMDFIDSKTRHSDTTNWMFAGLSQGATNAVETLVWPASLIGFGDPTNYRYNRVKKIVQSSMCNLRGSEQWNLINHKGCRMFAGSADGTCAQTYTDGAFTSWIGAGGYGTKTIIAGGGHDNGVWDSCFSPRATDTTHNMYLWLLGVGGTPPVTYTQAKVFDFFSGQWDNYDVNQVPWLWDNQKGGHSNVDPKNGVTTDTTSVNNPAHGFLTRYGTPRNDLDIYGFTQTNKTYPYPFKTGFSRALVTLDFTGLRNANDTTLQFVLQEVWWKDPGDTASLKIRLYNYDQQVMRKAVTSRWIYDSRPDSVCSQLDSLTSTASGNWEHVVIDSTGQRNRMRYLELMLTSTPTHHISKTPEICFYGYYTADTSLHMYSDSVRKPYTARISNKRDSTGIYRKKISTNVAQPVGLLSQAYDGGQRIFSNTNYYDNVNAPGIPSTITFWPAGSGDFTPTIINRNKAAGKDMILSTRGGNGYTGGNVNTDAPGIEAENPNNWSRDSALFSDLTKVYGRNSAGTNRFSGSPANGENLFPYLETGNEDYGNGYTFTANFWKARAEYRAIKQVDPTMQIIQPGMVYAGDVQQIKTIWWKTQVLTTDHIFPYNILNGHYYIADQDSLGGIIHTLTEQQNSGSVPPAWAVNSNNNWLTFTDSIKRQAYTYLSDTMQFWITETGRDGYGTKPTSDAQAAHTSQYTTASIAPWDSLRVKAFWDAQQNVFGWAASADRQVNFELTSVTVNPSAQPSDQFFSSGKGDNKAITDPFDLTTFLPAWYFNASMFRLQNYYCDSVMVNGGRTNKWVFRGHHYLFSDSVVYVVFFSTKTFISSSQSFNTPGLSTGLRVLPSFTTIADTTSTFTPSSGVTTATIEMRPQMFFGKEGAPAPPGCTTITGTSSITQTTATFNYNSALTATSYDIWINGSFVVNVSTLFYNATGLTANTGYTWNVYPRNASGAATGCTGASFSTLPNPPACTNITTPANGSTVAGSTTTNIIWNAASGASSYNVFIWVGAVPPPSTPTGSTSATNYLATTLSPSTTYNIFIQPSNSGGNAANCDLTNKIIFTTSSGAVTPWPNLFLNRN